MQAAALGKPETVAEIDIDNSAGKVDNTVKRSIWITKVKSSAWNLENKFSTKVDVKFTVGIPIIDSGKLSVSSSFEMATTENKGEVTTHTDLEQMDFNCLAPKGKYYKCRGSITKVKANMPYEIKRTVLLYNGTKKEKIVKSNFQGLMSSSIKFERCCYKNCDPKIENVCENWVKDAGSAGPLQCPKIEGLTAGAATPAKEQTLSLEEKFYPEVIADIQVIVGKETSCPHDYKRVTENDTSVEADWDYATYDSNKRYICVLKKKVSKLENSPVNVVRVSKNNKDCGTMRLGV